MPNSTTNSSEYTVYINCDKKFYNCDFSVEYYNTTTRQWVAGSAWSGKIDDNTNNAYAMGKFTVDEENDFGVNPVNIPTYFKVTVHYVDENKNPIEYVREINTSRNTDVWVDDTTNAYITKIRLTDGRVYNIADTTSNFAKWVKFEDNTIIPSNKGVFNVPNATTGEVYGVTRLSDRVDLNDSAYAATSKAVREAYNKTMYGTSSTSTGTPTKIVSCDGFILKKGARVAVKFTNAHKANTTSKVTTSLNVNSTGAKNISYNGATSISDMLWGTNETVNFIYDGSQYVMIKDSVATTDLHGITKLQNGIDMSKTSENSDTAATPEAVRKVTQDVQDGINSLSNDYNNYKTQHGHGNINNAGEIGTTSGYAVYTGANGVLTAGSLQTNDPTAESTTSTTFIDTISQDSKGKITATKKNVAVNLTNVSGADNLKAIEALGNGNTTGMLQKIGVNEWNLTSAAGTGTITGVQANGETVASEGTANIPAATTEKYGVTKLIDSVESNDTGLAATANSVKMAYDLAKSKPDIVVDSTEPTTKVAGDFWYEILQ